MAEEARRRRLSATLKKWWEINKRDNPEYIKWRNERLRIGRLHGKQPRSTKGIPTGRSPPNKGTKTGLFKKCVRCGTEFYVMPNKFESKRIFCSRECWSSSIRSPEMWHRVHPTVKWHARSLIKAIGKCEKCGFADKRILMVHHKDHNRKNKGRENLLVICPNCHALEHLNPNGRPDFRGWFKTPKSERTYVGLKYQNQ